eukprot:13403270-Alexandrium_andersonii.AAC.1
MIRKATEDRSRPLGPGESKATNFRKPHHDELASCVPRSAELEGEAKLQAATAARSSTASARDEGAAMGSVLAGMSM